MQGCSSLTDIVSMKEKQSERNSFAAASVHTASQSINQIFNQSINEKIHQLTYRFGACFDRHSMYRYYSMSAFEKKGDQHAKRRPPPIAFGSNAMQGTGSPVVCWVRTLRYIEVASASRPLCSSNAMCAAPTFASVWLSVGFPCFGGEVETCRHV